MTRVRTSLIAVALALAFIPAVGMATAPVDQPSPRPGPGSMGQGMMGPGMMGMMGCPAGGPAARGMMPMLPPGNDKLQLQMHAEIMQKVGEIVAKYANQLRDRP